jgi:hypothetical protein
MQATIWLLVLLFAPAAPPPDASARRTLTGEYHWTDGGDRDTLRATFSPSADGVFDVSFEFEFGGRSHTWSGTAKGSLAEGGKLAGTAEGPGGRTFAFEGAVERGALSCTHAETTRGRRAETGTFVLR